VELRKNKVKRFRLYWLKNQ